MSHENWLAEVEFLQNPQKESRQIKKTLEPAGTLGPGESRMGRHVNREIAREIVVAPQPSEVALGTMQHDQWPPAASLQVADLRAADRHGKFLMFTARHTNLFAGLDRIPRLRASLCRASVVSPS